MIKMNINSQCRVKLSTAGKNIIDNYTPLTYDADGYLVTELWEIMYLFGGYMYMGSQIQPFETELEIKPL